MYVHTTSYFLARGDIMKMAKDVMMMSLGAGAVLAYQKYKKPVMKKLDKVVDKTMQKANKKLEDMM